MFTERILSAFLIAAVTLLTACGPGIRFQPGEIPSPTAPNSYDLQQGHQAHSEVMQQATIFRDKAAERRVSSILSRLLDATPSTGHWTVTLIDDPTFNAMTAPGNYVFVYRGLLDRLPNDGQVAAVLAHEISHRLAQHEQDTSEEQLGKALAMLATLAAGAAVASQPTASQQDVQDIMEATHTLGSGFTTLRYSKDKEREADQVGMFLLADAGFDPTAAATLWASQAASEGSGGSDFFDTHPLHEDRYMMAAQLLPLAKIRYQEALEKRKKGKKNKPHSQAGSEVAAQIVLAENALANDDLETASTIAQSVAMQAPSHPGTYNLLGRVKALKGEPAQAHKAFQKGLSLAPRDPILIYNLACMKCLEGKREDALKSLQKAFSLRPSLTQTAPDDPDLSSLREDPEFTSLIQRQYLAPAPEEVGGNTFSIN